MYNTKCYWKVAGYVGWKTINWVHAKLGACHASCKNSNFLFSQNNWLCFVFAKVSDKFLKLDRMFFSKGSKFLEVFQCFHNLHFCSPLSRNGANPNQKIELHFPSKIVWTPTPHALNPLTPLCFAPLFTRQKLVFASPWMNLFIGNNNNPGRE